MGPRTRRDIASIDDHPARPLILALRRQTPAVNSDHLARLARAWNQSTFAENVRAKALSADMPLPLDLLRDFDFIAAMFRDDLSGAVPHPSLNRNGIQRAVATVRDAFAACYAQPLLTDGEFRALYEPWKLATGTGLDTITTLDDENITVLRQAAALATTSCHDPALSQLRDKLIASSFLHSERERDSARNALYELAVTLGRHRHWNALRAEVQNFFSDGCLRCGRDETRETHRAVRAAIDAACALLMADSAATADLDVIVTPMRWLFANYEPRRVI